MLRFNGSDSRLIPATQLFHEWVNRLNNEGVNTTDVSRGKPSFPKDEDAYNAILKFIEGIGDVFPYGTNCTGERKYKDKIVSGFKNEYGIEFSHKEIIFTQGGQFGLTASFYAIEKLLPNSKIITPKPWYLNHNDLAGMFSAGRFDSIPIADKFIPVDIFNSPEDNGRLTASNLQAAIDGAKEKGEKIGAFLFCNPLNPTGLITRKDEWQEIARVLEGEKDAYIMLDEAFAEVVFDCDFDISLLHAEHNLLDRIILFRSGTKALGFPGERLAVMRVPESLIDIITSFQGRLMGNPTLTSQVGISTAFETMTQEKKSDISKYYKCNFDFLYEEMANLNVAECVFKPEGGFYALYDFSSFRGIKLSDEAKEIAGTDNNVISNDYELAIAMMLGLNGDKDDSIVAIPASGFGFDSKDMVLRISYSSAKENLEKMIEKLSRLKKTL